MNIVKRIDQYNKNNIFFCEPIKNNVMNEGNFIRIIYSTHNVTLNGIYLLVTLNDITCDKYYTKYRCNFNITNHKEIIDNLKIIEEDLLKKTGIFDKIPQFKIYEQFKNGNLKIFSDVGNKSICSFILKISGIWETQNNYGLTYKFIKIN
jgi:Zn-dependent M16 (insulinase) family peptidase